MRERGVLLFSENYDHRYPHCWRCKNPVIFRATPQWFISMDQASADHPVEKDEDGRDRSNFTSNFADGETFEGSSLRVMSLREVDERVRWIPAWGRDRMRNMLKSRPDWCVSRQRVWGVPIPAFYCQQCQELVADAAVIRHVADIFEKETADAWYKREATELLPEGFKCPQCGAGDFTKETDILDVWFDSGSSSIAVLEARDNLRWPADVYIEGGDQFRGQSIPPVTVCRQFDGHSNIIFRARSNTIEHIDLPIAAISYFLKSRQLTTGRLATADILL